MERKRFSQGASTPIFFQFSLKPKYLVFKVLQATVQTKGPKEAVWIWIKVDHGSVRFLVNPAGTRSKWCLVDLPSEIIV